MHITLLLLPDFLLVACGFVLCRCTGLALKEWHAAARTRDDQRNGTTTLFAALNLLAGQLGNAQARHVGHDGTVMHQDAREMGA